MAVLKDAGNFPRGECLDLSAEKFQRVNYFIRAKGRICFGSQFSNTGAAGCVRKFQAMAWTTGARSPDESAGVGLQAAIAFAESTWLRSKNFWIFPVDVFGRSTKAQGTSPHFESGLATTSPASGRNRRGGS
jgi:hypothetical protein